MKIILIIVCVPILFFLGWAGLKIERKLGWRPVDVSALKVEWVGYPTFGTDYKGIDPGFYGDNPPKSQFFDIGKEMGFREDGVIVWREYKKEKDL